MIVGLAYDLRSEYLKLGYTEEETAEFDREDTIVAIEEALQQIGYQTLRIGNVKDLVQSLAAGKTWDIVFNICEGLYGQGREAQVPAILDAYLIPYTFSDPLVMALTLDKGMTKAILKYHGIATPDFLTIHDLKQLESVDLAYPLFAKPIAEGTGKGIDNLSKIDDEKQLKETCEKLLKRFKQPVLLEEFLPGKEFTVGIIGTGSEAKALGTMEVYLRFDVPEKTYGYTSKEDCEQLVCYELASDSIAQKCQALALQAWRVLGCRDGGRVDVKLDKHGLVQFLEVNPLAGLHPEHSDLPMLAQKKGYSYIALIRGIMDSACQRIGAK